MAWLWRLIEGECIGCGICADVCAEDAIRMTRDMAYPEVTAVRCVGCMRCAEECPVEAIEVQQESAAKQ
jgi:electron transfer flavoprotein alpha subunit